MFGLEDELHDAKQEIATLKAELQRFREREPLVQALLAAVDQVDSDAVRYGFGKVMSAVSDLEVTP